MSAKLLDHVTTTNLSFTGRIAVVIMSGIALCYSFALDSRSISDITPSPSTAACVTEFYHCPVKTMLSLYFSLSLSLSFYPSPTEKGGGLADVNVALPVKVR